MDLVIGFSAVLFAVLRVSVSEQIDVSKLPETYVAAVYEHALISPRDAETTPTRKDALDLMYRNLKIYQKQTQIAAEKNVQIILFPEYGITGFDQTRDSMVPYLEEVPDPKEIDWTPCVEPERFANTEVQTALSCMARKNSIHLVANMGSVVWCSNETDATCPIDGRYQHNTNVVFDHNGRLIVRYRKYNLADESPLMDPSPEAEFAFFDTPFGRFGTVICADLLFKQPTIELIEKHGIKNILLPSAWFNNPPFILAIQMYEGFAKSLNVNLLAANCRHREYKMAGSGIFTGQTIANYTGADFDDETGTLMMATVKSQPKQIRQPRMSRPFMGRHHTNFAKYSPTSNETSRYEYLYGITFTYTFLPETKHKAEIELCHSKVCCFLEYSFKNKSKEEFFALGVASGAVKDTVAAYLDICILRKCNGSDPDSCNAVGVESAETTFEHLTLRGNFSSNYSFPLVTTTPVNGGFDLAETEYNFSRHGSTIHSRGFTHPVLTVAILGRNYEKDPETAFIPSISRTAFSVVSGSDKACTTMWICTLSLVTLLI
ncbi:hypothetical protein ScPMuIL_015776 [Solemya velum]